MSPDEAVACFRRLGCMMIPRRGKGSHVWLERRDERGHQIAIFNVPTTRNPIATGTLQSLLDRNGIRDEQHLQELLADPDPAAAFLRVIPPAGPRYRPSGQ